MRNLDFNTFKGFALEWVGVKVKGKKGSKPASRVDKVRDVSPLMLQFDPPGSAGHRLLVIGDSMTAITWLNGEWATRNELLGSSTLGDPKVYS